MKRVSIICLVIITLFSCRKGRLDDYYIHLKGKWKLVYSGGHPVSTQYTYNNIYLPTDNVEIEFKGNAKIVCYKNGDKSSCDIIKKMTVAENIANGYIGYDFEMKKFGEMTATFTFLANHVDQGDSLSIDNFYPLDLHVDGHDTMYYYNVFVKE